MSIADSIIRSEIDFETCYPHAATKTFKLKTSEETLNISEHVYTVILILNYSVNTLFLLSEHRESRLAC